VAESKTPLFHQPHKYAELLPVTSLLRLLPFSRAEEGEEKPLKKQPPCNGTRICFHSRETLGKKGRGGRRNTQLLLARSHGVKRATLPAPVNRKDNRTSVPTDGLAGEMLIKHLKISRRVLPKC